MDARRFGVTCTRIFKSKSRSKPLHWQRYAIHGRYDDGSEFLVAYLPAWLPARHAFFHAIDAMTYDGENGIRPQDLPHVATLWLSEYSGHRMRGRWVRVRVLDTPKIVARVRAKWKATVNSGAN